MPRPKNLNTKIFLDSGDPEETKELKELLGFLDGQTTNPSLVAKNPEAKKKIKESGKFGKEEVFEFYREVVEEISEILPEGSISVEVYADRSTTTDEMLKQAKEMFGWIPNAHVKLPATKAGLQVANTFIEQGGRVNITLCFTQEQAAAVHSATRGAKRGDVYVSPFIGRWDDKDKDGISLVRNILNMYKEAGSHVEVLAASIRHLEHLKACLAMEVDIITAPFDVLKEWGESGMEIPPDHYDYDAEGRKPFSFEKFDLTQDWWEFDLEHKMTEEGMATFSKDWNRLILEQALEND